MAYAEFRVLDELLFEQAVLFKELSHTAFSDIVHHFSGKCSSLFLCHLFLNTANFVGLSFGDITFGNTFSDVLFVFADVEVETSLLQSSLHSLLYLLFLSLFDGNLQLFVLNRLGNASLIKCDRLHRGNLHGNGVTLFGSRLIGLNHGAEQVFAHVVVGVDVLAFDKAISVEFHLFASDTRTSNNGVFNLRAIGQRQGLHLVEVLSLSGYGSVENVLRKLNIILAIGHEVGFTLQGDDRPETVFNLHEHTSVRGFAV